MLADRPRLLAWYERQGYQRTGTSEPFPSGTRFGRPRQPLYAGDDGEGSGG
ncbi:MAG: hypothetical protein WKG07_37605 [Hymenobacter sp.]